MEKPARLMFDRVCKKVMPNHRVDLVVNNMPQDEESKEELPIE